MNKSLFLARGEGVAMRFSSFSFSLLWHFPLFYLYGGVGRVNYHGTKGRSCQLLLCTIQHHMFSRRKAF